MKINDSTPRHQHHLLHPGFHGLHLVLERSDAQLGQQDGARGRDPLASLSRAVQWKPSHGWMDGVPNCGWMLGGFME